MSRLSTKTFHRKFAYGILCVYVVPGNLPLALSYDHSCASKTPSTQGRKLQKTGPRVCKEMAHCTYRSCDSRKYAYSFPTYLLIPPRPGSGLFHSLRRQNGGPPAHQFWEFHDPRDDDVSGDEDSSKIKTSARPEELQRKRAWRINAAELDALRVAAKHLEGTHNFHNFTVNKDFRDRSNQRHMKEILVTNPMVHGETEWISVLLHGQSFMLHQVFTL